ncbi:MAG TPA: hypothetical protein VJX67_10635 [Blastocatellia bacterium]|nr:hypothetical protein [Blastocatellia bacterium]
MDANLRLKREPGLLDCLLENLGNVNVICGKNNTGKTTILTALGDSEADYGVAFTKANLDYLANLALDGQSWIANQDFVSFFMQVLAKTVGRKACWFASQEQSFVNAVQSEVSEKIGTSVNMPGLSDAYSEILGGRKRAVLLPPTRNLETQSTIQTGQRPTPDGMGILNYLSYSKNQFTSHPDYLLHERIRSAFKEISTGYDFAVPPRPGNQIVLHFSRDGANWVPADRCGLGLHHLLVLLTFATCPTSTSS